MWFAVSLVSHNIRMHGMVITLSLVRSHWNGLEQTGDTLKKDLSICFQSGEGRFRIIQCAICQVPRLVW